jgi:hypothetical protein
VRASLASDAIAAAVLERRPNAALAYLTSPGTAFPIPKRAWDDSKARHARERWTWWHQPLWLFTGGFKENCRPPAKREKKLRVIDEDAEMEDDAGSVEMFEDVYVHDGHLVLQGPNYALAKTLQNWRAIVAREDGHCVSANVAPASRTESMLHVDAVRRGLEGQKHFAPLRAFAVEETREMMCALLLHDLGSEGSSARPAWGREDGRHPFDAFSVTAAHGGTWRCAFSVDSIGKAAYVLGSTIG